MEFSHFIKNGVQQQDKKVIRTPKKSMTDQISKTIRQKKVIFYKSWSRAELKTSLESRILSASTCVIPSTLPVGRLLADYRGIYMIRSSY